MRKKTNNQHSIVRSEELDKKNLIADSLEDLHKQLQACKEREQRALADYQNLVRRQQQERLQLMQQAASGLIEDLLQSLSHLDLASKQLTDAGLQIVIEQFWQVLSQHGVTKINPIVGTNFEVATMEAIDDKQPVGSKQRFDDSKDTKKVVKKVVSCGYKLYDKVLQYAKVIVE